MRATKFNASLIRSGLAAAVLLVAATASYAQSVDLTAAPTQAALPDGQTVPMWGYTCGTSTGTGVSCAAANPNAGTNWSPVVITVPSGTNLTINLTNGLVSAGTPIPTSLVIVGQLGGGLGGTPTTTPSPAHGPQGATWPASGPADPTADCVGNRAGAGALGTNCPPAQPARVQSFATEVAAGATTALVWNNLRPGTYLIESGTHPSIQGPMGLYGVLVVTNAADATGGTPGTAYPGITYSSELPLVLSEIDAVQNATVAAAVATAGFSETRVWDGKAGGCGDPASATFNTCYPPAVNYDPRYFLINGVSYDQGIPGRSQFATTGLATGSVLVRFVNAGLRMHVPSIVGAQTGTVAVPGVALIAEDGNVLPGVPKIQNEVFLAAGKTQDVLINDIGAGLNVYDRQLSLSTNNRRGGGMMANINRTAGSGTAPAAGTANGETYFCVAGTTLAVSDPAKGVLANDPGANGAALSVVPPALTSGTLTFQSNGTFTYNQAATDTACGGTFTYVVNGRDSATATIQECDAAVHAAGCTLGGPPTAGPVTFTSSVHSRYASPPPGVLAGASDPSGLPLSAVPDPAHGLNADGSFVMTPAAGSCAAVSPAPPAGSVCETFNYVAKNSQGRTSAAAAATVIFLPASGLNVVVYDAKTAPPAAPLTTGPGVINDYRWIIEEDRTFYVDPKCQINSTNPALRPSTCPALPVQSLGYNFHTANMPVVAAGCVGTVSCEAGQTFDGGTTPVACDVGNGACRAATQKPELLPSQVYLDPTKRYYISILPGDGTNPDGGPVQVDPTCDPSAGDCAMRQFRTSGGAGNLGDCTGFVPGVDNCGHGMGGQQISGALVALNQNTIRVPLERTPFPSAKIAAFIFADDNPLNGEADAGGAAVGVTGLAANEPGLGGFNIVLLDQAGGLGDSTGQATYDEFGQPLSNSLAGTIDPLTGFDACPISTVGDGIVGMITVCPELESDGVHESPLVGQAVIANLYPGLYEPLARPGADRIAKGEEWLQTNTLDGGAPFEAFIKADEPGYFQEFGPGSFHVSIGFANADIINARRHKADGTGLCDAPHVVGGINQGGGGLSCTQTVYGQVTNAHMSRTPDQRIFSSGDYSHYGFTQCYVGMGPPDDADFAFAKCNADGSFVFENVPVGDYKLTVFDQWNDIMLDGLVSPIHVAGQAGGGAPGSSASNPIVFPVTQWRTDLYTRTFLDVGDGTAGSAGDGVSEPDEPGLPLVATNIRYRDGSFGFFNNTDLDGYAGFNEVFPFMNWLVVESDTTRFKGTGTHVVYDAGGPVASTGIAAGLAGTIEAVPLPAALRVPGARYCASADCPPGDSAGGSSGRVDPPTSTEGWQGLLGQDSFIEFGMKPFAVGETGGIKGHVIYSSTRPFDNPALLLQLSWEPGVPRVKLNLYKEGTAPDGSTSLTLVDTTTSSSWDDWAQGFHPGPASGGAVPTPNMNCPGQDPASPFFATLADSRQWLNPGTAIPNHAQFKCFDGWAMLNQVQPAPYDGMYKFPSVTATDPVTGRATGTNCTGCVPNPDTSDAFRVGTPMLPAGKYVVEVIVPPGMELVKEEDKNILLGDIYIAPVTTQFAGFGNVFIMPDQATVGDQNNKNNPGGLNTTANLGAVPRHEGDTGSVETFWPCVGAMRQVPDWNSLFPGAGQNSPFAGAIRPLCDRKEVTLEDQHSALAKFYIFSSVPIAGHFAGTITNDFASEFDPFSPQFGEKFGPPNLPVGLRDFAGKEMGRVYSDQWGIYNGLNYSSYAVNPPAPTGYIPQMMIACMNDPGPIAKTNAQGLYVNAAGAVVPTADLAAQITDPSYNPAYSNFCYETPYMPGFTAYMDTPVIPTQAFADGYNLPDSEYPDATPAISSVTSSDGAGPWVSATGAGHTLTIKCLGIENTTDPCSKVVQNPAFSGPGATTEPYNQKTLVRHYGFGSTPGTVTIAGVTATCGTWSNTQLVCTVPTISATLNSAGVGSTCYSGTSNTIPAGQTPPQRNANGSVITGASLTNYRCGQLVVKAANGKQSIDAITVTVAGKAPTYVNGENGTENAIQLAVDAAAPGDLIIVGPGTYHENVLMWKPVRLQGVGSGAVTINADAHPVGKMDPWRRQVVCLFGLSLNGVPRGGADGTTNVGPFDPTGTYSCPASMYLRDDRIPFEAIVGWDATGNGNLAQVLQEPTLMGAYEGAGVSVLGRGIRIPANSTDFWGLQGGAVAGAFPDGSTYLTNSTTNCARVTSTGAPLPAGRDYGTSNFMCNPSRIDGFSVINSSQGGGGIFIHGWNHFLEVANNRVYANHGTLSGGVNLGNGEVPPPFLNDGTICGNGVPQPRPLCPPTTGVLANAAIPYAFNTRVRVHHNDIYNNAGLGDALFSATPSGAGGITISSGSDSYRIDHNWISGNLATGDGAGIEHSGLNFNGTIDHNYILFNQSTNPTLPTNGGGIGVIGANGTRLLPDGTECGTITDVDCPPAIGDGTGSNLLIDSNLILGNSAETGSGGGIRLQQVTGSEATTFPYNLTPSLWYGVTLQNNIIANNVAGWDGAGVSMEDALKVTIVNNTIVSNDTTASAGVLFKTLGAIMAASPPPGCNPTTDVSTNPQDPNCLGSNAAHIPQPAGLVVEKNTPNLMQGMNGLPSLLGAKWVCPSGYSGGLGPINADCGILSRPAMTNDLFWQNRAFHVEITGSGTGLQSQQNLVSLLPLLNQAVTGDCAPGASYWDIGVRDDASPTNHSGGGTLSLSNSILTSLTGYTGNGNRAPANSPVNAQYCNGSRVPPENGGHGYQAPPGRSETTGLSQIFVFNNITPAATVDEGNNWINLTYGPLTLFNNAAQSMIATAPGAVIAGAYSIGSASAARDGGTNSGAPSLDYFGQPRPATGTVADIGAVEFQAASVGGVAVVSVSPSVLAFGQVATGTTVTRDLIVANNGGATFTGMTIGGFAAPFSRVTVGVTGNCGTTLAAGASCTIRVAYAAPAPIPAVPTATGSVTITGSVAVVNAPVALSGTSVAVVRSLSVGPTPLAFGNWATGSTSVPRVLTALNTGNVDLAGMTYTFSGAGFSRPAGAAGGTCAATLAAGASCTINVVFTPTAVTSYSRTLAVAATSLAPSSVVTLTGAGVSGAAPAAVTPSPLTITLPTGSSTGSGVVTLTNNAPLGGGNVGVNSVTVAGGSALTFVFAPVSGGDNCTGAVLPPQSFCSVQVSFTNVLSSRGTTRSGTITFGLSGATPASAVGQLRGFATR
jgi:hypothetical protein